MSIKLKDIYQLLLMISLVSLGFAYFVEYAMDHAPCVLCVYQRFPYLVLITISIVGLAKQEWRAGLFYSIGAVFCSIMLAGYHTGLELGFFEPSSFCKPLVSISDNLSINDFKNMLYNTEMPLCNKPALVILKLSMTQWNLLLNFGLFTILIILMKWDNKNAKTLF